VEGGEVIIKTEAIVAAAFPYLSLLNEKEGRKKRKILGGKKDASSAWATKAMAIPKHRPSAPQKSSAI